MSIPVGSFREGGNGVTEVEIHRKAAGRERRETSSIRSEGKRCSRVRGEEREAHQAIPR